MASEHQLLARLLDGTALRLSQGLGRWGKHIEFTQRAIDVQRGNGGKDCVVMLPALLMPSLRAQWAASQEV